MFASRSNQNNSLLLGDIANRTSRPVIDGPENLENGSGARFLTWRAESKQRSMSPGATKAPESSRKPELAGVCRKKRLNF